MALKDLLQPNLKEADVTNPPFSALEILAQYPVMGNEESLLTSQFACSVEALVSDEHKQYQLYEALQTLNPNYEYKTYSLDAKANILANVVAAIYAPLIHAFSEAVLKNIQQRKLSPVIVAPPRDAFPLANSLAALAQLKGMNIKILQPAITRVIAGIKNLQGESPKTPTPDPLLQEYILQEFGEYLQFGFTEVEPGIYSTTSMAIAQYINELGSSYTALKMYGLGPNLSFVHALLSDGKGWIAETIESEVGPQLIADLMTLLDSIEEFGMEKLRGKVTGLTRKSGKITPMYDHNPEHALHIAQTTNVAIVDTAAQYANGVGAETARYLLLNFNQIVQLAKLGFPVCLTAAIPPGPASDKDKHFERIRTNNLLNFPQDLEI